MKTCCAGHDLIAFGAARCPLCVQIERSDKETLKLHVMLEDLRRINTKLTNAQVSNVRKIDARVERLKEMLPKEPYTEEQLKSLDWNGGAT